MFKKFLVLTVLLFHTVHVNSIASAIQTQTNGNITTHNHTNDFITQLNLPLPSLPTDKHTLIKELDNLTKDIKNNPNMAAAFNVIFNSSNLTAKEKTSWLKQNIYKLPTPFILLIALFEEDVETAKYIYFLASARMIIDADMCSDVSAQQGITILKHIVLPEIFNRFGIDKSNTDPQKYMLIFNNIEKSFFKKGGFRKFDKDYPVSFTPLLACVSRNASVFNVSGR